MSLKKTLYALHNPETGNCPDMTVERDVKHQHKQKQILNLYFMNFNP